MNDKPADSTRDDSLDRRKFVGTLGALGAMALAGCPENEPEEDEPADGADDEPGAGNETDGETPTEDETDGNETG